MLCITTTTTTNTYAFNIAFVLIFCIYIVGDVWINNERNEERKKLAFKPLHLYCGFSSLYFIFPSFSIRVWLLKRKPQYEIRDKMKRNIVKCVRLALWWWYFPYFDTIVVMYYFLLRSNRNEMQDDHSACWISLLVVYHAVVLASPVYFKFFFHQKICIWCCRQRQVHHFHFAIPLFSLKFLFTLFPIFHFASTTSMPLWRTRDERNEKLEYVQSLFGQVVSMVHIFILFIHSWWDGVLFSFLYCSLDFMIAHSGNKNVTNASASASARAVAEQWKN